MADRRSLRRAPQHHRLPLPQRAWRRLVSDVGLLVVVACGMLGIGIYLGIRVMDALPDVGKNLHVADSWGAPIAVERRTNGRLVAHVPPCAQSPVAGLFLWDDQNRPLWEVRGQAFPIGDFYVGAVPAGLKVVQKFHEPSRDQVLKLGMFRASGRPAGVTFRIRDLRSGTVRYRGKWLTVNEFKVSATCPQPKVKQPKTST